MRGVVTWCLASFRVYRRRRTGRRAERVPSRRCCRLGCAVVTMAFLQAQERTKERSVCPSPWTDIAVWPGAVKEIVERVRGGVGGTQQPNRTTSNANDNVSCVTHFCLLGRAAAFARHTLKCLIHCPFNLLKTNDLVFFRAARC